MRLKSRPKTGWTTEREGPPTGSRASWESYPAMEGDVARRKSRPVTAEKPAEAIDGN